MEKLHNHMQKVKLDPCLTPHTKINGKWVKDKRKPWNHKVLRRKPWRKNPWNSSWKWFRFGFDIKTTTNKNKWNYIKLKSFCTAKESINKMKKQPTQWEKIFANQISDKGLILKICKVPVFNNKNKTLI